MQTYHYKNNSHIESSIDNLLTSYSAKHSQVLTVRFDLHYPQNFNATSGNSDVVKFIAKAKQKLNRDGLDPKYMWVREQHLSHNPHYHCVFLLNGHKTRDPRRVFSVAEKLWGSTLGYNAQGLVNYCYIAKDGTSHRNGIMLSKSKEDYDDSLIEVKRQLGYLAKAEHKGTPKDHVRDFGMSSLQYNTQQSVIAV